RASCSILTTIYCFTFSFSLSLCCSTFVFLIHRTHPRVILFPYTTLFRSICEKAAQLHPDDEPLPLPHETLRDWSFRIGGLRRARSEEHTCELQSRENLVCRLLLEKKNIGLSSFCQQGVIFDSFHL